MMNAARSMCGCTAPTPARLPIERPHRWAVRRSRLSIAAAQDGSRATFADDLVDRASRTGDQRDRGRLVALAENAQRPVAPFGGGKRALPADLQARLRLIGTRGFVGGVVYAHYAVDD